MPVNGHMRWILAAIAAVGLILTLVAAVSIARLAFRHTSNLVAYDPTPGPQIVIGLDISQDNPLVADRAFALRAGGRLDAIIRDLPSRSLVTIRAFGDYGVSPGPLNFDRVISVRQPGETVGDFIGAIVGGVPEIVGQGRVTAHSRSNILAFLEGMSQSIDCKRGASVYLVTDGLEDSEYATLSDPDATLPDPPGEIFPECDTLQMVGIGHGQTSPIVTRRLTAQWREWARKAGFKNFQGLSTW